MRESFEVYQSITWIAYRCLKPFTEQIAMIWRLQIESKLGIPGAHNGAVLCNLLKSFCSESLQLVRQTTETHQKEEQTSLIDCPRVWR